MNTEIAGSDVQIAATLASIAYLGSDSNPDGERALMAEALLQGDLPTQGQWTLAWGPVPLKSNLMYIVQGPATLTGRRYAIAIRGTIKSVQSVLEDIEEEQVDLPWPSPSALPGTRISEGIRTAFERLLDMRDPMGRGAMDFLATLKPGDDLFVCGHSLGGCLTTVMALYLRDNLNLPHLGSIPLAGQTAGNQLFANWYSSVFGGSARFANRLDLVPRLANHKTLEEIKSLYPDGPKCDLVFRGLVDVALLASRHHFFQPEPGTILDGALYHEAGWGSFEEEVEAQHDHRYYMYLTGVSLAAIQGTPTHPGLGSDWYPPGHDKRSS